MGAFHLDVIEQYNLCMNTEAGTRKLCIYLLMQTIHIHSVSAFHLESGIDVQVCW